MIYKFRIISGENEEFIREVAIDSQATFLDLHNFIVQELGYDKSQITSFYITDRNWNKETEITLIDMTGEENSQLRVMDQTKLGELITEKKQRLLYVFDPFTERALFMEMYQIEDKTIEQPKCIRRRGTPPPQFDQDAIKNIDIDELEDNELKEDDIFPDDDENGMTSFDEEEWI